LVAVAGGKWTTYRVMAKDAIDAAVLDLDGDPVPESITDEVPLVGADGFAAAWNSRARLSRRYGVTPAILSHLLGRYGSLATEVVELIEKRPELGDALPGSPDYLRAEVVYAVSHEGALHLDDVLARRTRMSIEVWDRGVSAAPEVAVLMAEGLGWSDDQMVREVRAYLDRVSAELDSQMQPDDTSADRARLRAEEVDAG
jgi:glycerol-3-phosphate dehydrogenase